MSDDARLDALLGQVLMVAPPDGWLEGTLDWLDELQPAGVILFRRNLPADPEAARLGIARLRAWAAARGEILLVAMDEEGGFVTQTSHYMPTPPSARAFAWAAEPEAARLAFTAHGRRLRSLGVNLDFAPVCDVNNNPKNPVIGVRSFGSEPQVVGRFAQAVHEGLTAAGVLSCAKHFPGHGDTELDSHLTLPFLHHDRAHMEEMELAPFRALLPQVPVVMVAHLACPKIGDGELPATLSARITTDLLRRELGFEGVAVTDAMDMQGVAAAFDPKEAAVRAVLAGCDLLLYCFEIERPQRARVGLRAALESGRLPRARLQQAATRVERLRALAAARGDTPQAAEPLPPVEKCESFYREICGKALRFENPAGWRSFAVAARAAGRLLLVGWQEQTLDRLARRLGRHGLEVEVRSPDAVGPEPGAPLLVVLAERRPLAPERVAILRALAEQHGRPPLANLLTPEVDAPVADAFGAVLRSADETDCMLETLAERLVGLGTTT